VTQKRLTSEDIEIVRLGILEIERRGINFFRLKVMHGDLSGIWINFNFPIC